MKNFTKIDQGTQNNKYNNERYPDNCPNGHDREGHHPEDPILKGHDPKWAPSQMDTISNRHDLECTPSRMDTIPNGHNSEWTLSQMDLSRVITYSYLSVVYVCSVRTLNKDDFKKK